MRYLSWDVIRSGRVTVQIIRHVVYEFQLQRLVIEVSVYQAHDFVSGQYYPPAETPEEASMYALLAGGLKS